MKRGFVILAHSRLEYLQMAYNLAVSMKYAGTKYPIAAITDLNPGDLKDASSNKAPKVFDEVIPLKGDLGKLKAQYPFYIKTRLPELTPFDETIYLDADALFLKSPDFLFDLWDTIVMIVTGKRVLI